MFDIEKNMLCFYCNFLKLQESSCRETERKLLSRAGRALGKSGNNLCWKFIKNVTDWLTGCETGIWVWVWPIKLGPNLKKCYIRIPHTYWLWQIVVAYCVCSRYCRLWTDFFVVFLQPLAFQNLSIPNIQTFFFYFLPLMCGWGWTSYI